MTTDYEPLLTRKQLAGKLTENGFKTSVSTLNFMACRGGGPDYVRYGKQPLYRWSVALEWAYARLESKSHRPASRAYAESAAS